MNKKIQLNKVRLSFPSLFKKYIYKGEEKKYAATLLIDKEDKNTLQMLSNEFKALQRKSQIFVTEDKRCISDGNKDKIEDYAGYWVLKSSSPTKPTVCDDKYNLLDGDNTLIYPGCYVNVIVSFWVLNHPEQKRLCCNLHGVMFHSDAPPFGAIPVESDEELINQFKTKENLIGSDVPRMEVITAKKSAKKTTKKTKEQDFSSNDNELRDDELFNDDPLDDSSFDEILY